MRDDAPGASIGVMFTFIASPSLAATLLLVTLCPMAAPHAVAPNVPVILVASEKGAGSVGELVVLAVPIGNGRHFGFVLNQPTDTPLSDLFPGEGVTRFVDSRVHVGGPVLPLGVFAVVRVEAGASGPAQLSRITPELSIALNSEEVDAVITTSPGDARYFMGLVLWTPDELAGEIKAGVWQLRAADANVVMNRNPGSLWTRLSGRGALYTVGAKPIDLTGAPWTLIR